jgi:hypothetical protein
MTAEIDLGGTPMMSFAEILSTKRIRHGYLKCRLVHRKGLSFILPDVLMTSGLTRQFISPQFFYPNRIAFFGGDGAADVCSIVMATIDQVDLEIAFFRRNLFKHCADGSFIYKCAYKTVNDVPFPNGQGTWRRKGDTFELALYHHTNEAGFHGIKSSGELWSSPWNIQGTQKLKNIGYGYFTSLQHIKNELDLKEIAMSEDGVAHFLPTNAPMDPHFATSIPVPQQTAKDRTKMLQFWVDTEMISPSHVWLHCPLGQSTYYEVVLPKVFRVGVQPGATLPFRGTRLAVPKDSTKILPYAIVGDADNHAGLIAPYNEEETQQLAKIDFIPKGIEIIGRWQEKQNTSLFPKMNVELARFIEDSP